MSSSHHDSHSNTAEPMSPATWDVDMLRENWINHLQALANENNPPIPLKRLKIQAEEDTLSQEIMKGWPRMDGPTRLDSWKRLMEESERHVQELLPTCVQCGECCRKGSPSLHMDDLELLRGEKISWDQLVTLRRGEPVRSPFNGKLFFLLDERIKIKEKEGTQECVFLDGESDLCSIYENRPVQCRAQACWDSTAAEQLAEQPYLTRRDIFQDVELLMDLMSEHDRRCAFEKLHNAFQRLEQEKNEALLDEIVNLLAYEDHFRHFLAKQLNIPENVLHLVFGRSFAELVPLFGFRVETESDGSRCLVPDLS